MSYLLVGLGNPGNEYASTRHNIGFMAIDAFADRNTIPMTQKKFSGLFATGFCLREKVHLLMPQTYMNLSGKSVVPAANFFDIDFEKVIVVHDEIDLPLGQMKIKIDGGHGGHNGLRDVIAKSGRKDFIRLRLGVGRPERGDVADHVLGKFKKSEVPEVEEILELAVRALETIVQDGPTAAQNKYN